MSGIPATSPGAAGTHGVGPRPAPRNPEDPWARLFIADVALGEASGGTYGAGLARYVVGGARDAVVLRRFADRAERAESARKFIADNPRHTPGQAWGWWRDGDTSRVWLDVADTFDDVRIALAMAETRGELAIWDRQEEREIRLFLA